MRGAAPPGRPGVSAASPAQLADIAERLERLEQGIDATAIEVERIAEVQRFTTRLLAERQERDPVAIPRSTS